MYSILKFRVGPVMVVLSVSNTPNYNYNSLEELKQDALDSFHIFALNEILLDISDKDIRKLRKDLRVNRIAHLVE